MKKVLVAVLLVLLAAGMVFAGGKQEESGMESEGAAAEGYSNPRAAEMSEDSGIAGFQFADHIIKKVENGEELDIKIVHQDVSLEFSQVIGAGVEAAGDDLGCETEFTGSTAEHSIEDMVAVIENLIIKRVDGIGVANVSAEALNPVIDKAIDAGIPTIMYGTPAPGSKAFCFIGQDLVQSGVAQGDIIAEYTDEKAKVIIFSCSVAAQWSIDREKGVREAIAKYPDMEVVQIIETGTEDQQVYATIENAIRANPDVKAFATLCAVSTPVTGRVIKRMGLTGEVVHVGHDLETETLENIKDGATQASLSQDPFKQGYEAVRTLYNYIQSGVVPKDIDTGILRVDETNIDVYLQKLEEGEPIG